MKRFWMPALVAGICMAVARLCMLGMHGVVLSALPQFNWFVLAGAVAYFALSAPLPIFLILLSYPGVRLNISRHLRLAALGAAICVVVFSIARDAKFLWLEAARQFSYPGLHSAPVVAEGLPGRPPEIWLMPLIVMTANVVAALAFAVLLVYLFRWPESKSNPSRPRAGWLRPMARIVLGTAVIDLAAQVITGVSAIVTISRILAENPTSSGYATTQQIGGLASAIVLIFCHAVPALIVLKGLPSPQETMPDGSDPVLVTE